MFRLPDYCALVICRGGWRLLTKPDEISRKKGSKHKADQRIVARAQTRPLQEYIESGTKRGVEKTAEGASFCSCSARSGAVDAALQVLSSLPFYCCETLTGGRVGLSRSGYFAITN